jgi:hypothetical protein
MAWFKSQNQWKQNYRKFYRPLLSCKRISSQGYDRYVPGGTSITSIISKGIPIKHFNGGLRQDFNTFIHLFIARYTFELY